MSNTIYKPYFYILEDIETGMLYAGSKYGVDANPDTFWKEDGYKTSSTKIKRMIDSYGLIRFKVNRLVIREDAYEYETRFLKKVDAANNPRFYNGHNNDGVAFGTTLFEQSMLGKYGVTHPSQLPEHNQKVVSTNIEKYGVHNVMLVDEVANKQSRSLKQTYASVEWQNTVGEEKKRNQSSTLNDPVWQSTKGEEKKRKLRDLANNRKTIKCPHCGKEGKGGVMYVWHFDKCKYKN